MMDMHPPCFLTKTRCTYKLCGKIYLCVSSSGSWRMQRKWVIPRATVTHGTWVILLRNSHIDRGLKVANIYWTKTRSRFRNKNIIQLTVLVNFNCHLTQPRIVWKDTVEKPPRSNVPMGRYVVQVSYHRYTGETASLRSVFMTESCGTCVWMRTHSDILQHWTWAQGTLWRRHTQNAELVDREACWTNVFQTSRAVVLICSL